MTNEYGVMLDSNGYAPSVIDAFAELDSACFLCRRRGDLARHEVFHGTAYRQKAKAYGCWVYLCPECHDRLHRIDPKLDRQLKQIGQRNAMEWYEWTVEDFRERFGKSYVEEA